MFGDIELTPLFQKASEWACQDYDWSSPATYVKATLLFALSAALLVWAAAKVTEGLVKLKENYLAMGLPAPFRTAPQKADLRRRQQFAGMLRSDLAVLAKAENWNDQYFTDLEAEVEAEGGYYASLLRKLFKRKSFGLRRVPSLVEAIQWSSEHSLLLVGEPGSGKSVALRHLAHQLAERASRSSDLTAPIPLYVNLRELPAPASNDAADADFIKAFVIDNVRRGDADTADYVREKWNEYRDKGIWFFLVDSFDEIPGVMHAPTGGGAIKAHAEAIRHFLDGMSACRGILASREYKGPDALPWQKLRILPLSEQRQDELISNSFMSADQKNIAVEHLASRHSSLRHNPLFLALLCRYVKEENHAPLNDHDLLSRHIDRLANRDPEYTHRKYALTPDQLIEGATQLAVLFAESPNISLAPTHHELSAAIQRKRIPGGDLSNFLAALVDVKIGRADFQEARRGDRRFAFSHRRYQETLFVRYLAENPSYISYRQLLTDLRWREYAVTLLQTQSLSAVYPLLDEAVAVLMEIAHARKPLHAPREYGKLLYYEWEPVLTHVVGLLQEGMARRMDDVPTPLSQAMERVLTPRWDSGDLFDRAMVIWHGGLLPQHVLTHYVREAVATGIPRMRDEAFRMSPFLVLIPSDVARWLRHRLANEVLAAKDRASLLRLQALAAHLPRELGGTTILDRCRRLRRLLAMKVLVAPVFQAAERVMGRLAPGRLPRFDSTEGPRRPEIMTIGALLYVLGLWVVGAVKSAKTHAGMPITGLQLCSVLLACGYATVILWLSLIFACRSYAGRLSLTVLWRRLRQGIPVVPVIALLIVGVVGGAAHLTGYALGKRDWTWQWYALLPGALTSVAMVFGAVMAIHEYRLRSRERTRLSRRREDMEDGLALAMTAGSARELRTWLTDVEKPLLLQRDDARVVLCLASRALQASDDAAPVQFVCGDGHTERLHDVEDVAELLLERLGLRSEDAGLVTLGAERGHASSFAE